MALLSGLASLGLMKFISGLILGAGASQRFGQPKQLSPFRGTTLLGWVVEQTQQAAGLDEVVVVLGRAADEIRRRVNFGNAKVVENPVFGEGCASSYRAGIGNLDPRSEALMIILGDQPGIGPDKSTAWPRVAAKRRKDRALLLPWSKRPSNAVRESFSIRSKSCTVTKPPGS